MGAVQANEGCTVIGARLSMATGTWAANALLINNDTERSNTMLTMGQEKVISVPHSIKQSGQDMGF